METAANVRTYSRSGRDVSARSVSSIDLSPRRDSHVCSENSPPDLTLHHTRKRRAVVKEDNLCPRSEFRDVGIEESNKKDNKKKHQGERKIKAFECFIVCLHVCVLRENFKQNLSKKKKKHTRTTNTDLILQFARFKGWYSVIRLKWPAKKVVDDSHYKKTSRQRS